jgi:DNA polymerase-3 subunit epsilon
MGLVDRLLGRRREAHRRWAVVDVETSGMDVASDAVISVGAVAMHEDGHVLPGDSIEIIVRQDRASPRENIVVHGVGVDAQLNGVDPRAAVSHFLEYVGTAPLLAFHAPFDRGFLARVVKFYVNQPFDNPWLDVAELAPALYPDLRLKSLDEWLQRFGIPVGERHSAAADAFATALLAARLLPEARRQGADSFGRMMKLARNARWVR